MSTRTIKAFKGTLTSLVQFGVLMVLQIVLTPYILKTAGQEVLGAYSILMQIIGYGLLLDFGLSVALVRYLSQSFSAKDKSGIFKKTFNVGRYFILATNVLLSLFLMVVAFNVDLLINGSQGITDDAQTALFMLSTWYFIRVPLILYGHGLLASQNMATANIIGLISSVGRLILSLYLIYSGLGLLGLVSANIIAEAASLLLQRHYFIKLYPALSQRWELPDYSLIRELFSFGLTYWGVNVAIIMTTGSDTIIVGSLYGAATAAIYHTTKMPALLFIQIIYKISDNAAPAANELLGRGNYEALRSAYIRILRYSLLIALPVSIGVIVFNEGIISAWVGVDQYAGSVMSLALAVFVLTQVINHINAMITVASGKMRYWMSISVITGFITMALAYTFGKLLGMQWVMVAIAFMDLPGFIFLMHRCLSILDLTYIDIFGKAILPVTITALPLIGLDGLVTATDQITNIVGLVVLIAVWLLGLYIFGINKQERLLMRSKLGFK